MTSNWFSSTFETLRERSLDALKFVQNDLNEFRTIVKSDAESYLTKMTKKPMKPNEKFVAPPIDRFQSEKFQFENDDETYLVDSQPIDFNVDERKNEIAQILIDSPHIRAIYSRLVPTATSHNEFWSRYFARLTIYEEKQHRRTHLLKRAEEMCQKNDFQRTKSSDWDDFDDESIEVSQKEQPTMNENQLNDDEWEF